MRKGIKKPQTGEYRASEPNLYSTSTPFLSEDQQKKEAFLHSIEGYENSFILKTLIPEMLALQDLEVLCSTMVSLLSSYNPVT